MTVAATAAASAAAAAVKGVTHIARAFLSKKVVHQKRGGGKQQKFRQKNSTFSASPSKNKASLLSLAREKAPNEYCPGKRARKKKRSLVQLYITHSDRKARTLTGKHAYKKKHSPALEYLV